MTTVNFIYNDKQLTGKEVLNFDFLGFTFQIVKAQKYFYILCQGVYMWVSTFEFKTALECQMHFVDKCTRLKITPEYIQNFINDRK